MDNSFKYLSKGINMSAAQYFEAPAVKEIADDLIGKYHQHLLDYSVKLRYLFVDKTTKSAGAEVWGMCKKVSGLNAYLESKSTDGDAFFAIIISKDIWDVLPQEKKVALVDHELCHAWAEAKQQKDDGDSDADLETDNPVKLSVKPHDLEEFSCIVKRHGLWRESIEEFVEAALKAKT